GPGAAEVCANPGRVGRLSATERKGRILRCSEAQWLTLGKGHNAVHLPLAQDCVGEAVPGRANRFSLSQRQLISHIRDKSMRLIVRGDSVLTTPAVPIADRAGSAPQAVCSIRHCLRPAIRREQTACGADPARSAIGTAGVVRTLSP